VMTEAVRFELWGAKFMVWQSHSAVI